MFDDRLGIMEQPLQRAENVLARGREHHSALVSVEEADTQALLELLHLDGQRGLRNMQIVGSACEVARLCNFEKSSDVTELVNHRNSRL